MKELQLLQDLLNNDLQPEWMEMRTLGKISLWKVTSITIIKINQIYKLENNGCQLLWKQLDLYQFVLELMVLMEQIAQELFAVVLMDQRMDQPVLLALEKNQLLFHTTIPSQLLDNDIKTLVTFFQLIHLLLTHQLQFQLLFFKLNQQKVPTKKQPLPSDPDSTTKVIQNQKKILSSTQKSPEHIQPSMLKANDLGIED